MLVHQGDEVLLELVLALRSNQSTLQQDRTQLVDQRRSFAHQPIARPVQRLHVELRLALHLDKSHGWSRRGFGDPPRHRGRRSSAP